MDRKSGSVVEWVMPLTFILCASYVIWNFPKYIVSFGWASDALKAQHESAGLIDYIPLLAIPVLFYIGCMTIRTAHMEYEDWFGFDRISLLIGRITMLLIALVVGVMFYEVVLRYVFERPTLWANELSLWMAGFVFLLSGLYAMQQRCHIRIYLLYDILPRWLQRVCDMISTALIVVFAAAMVYGGYGEASAKLLRWETFGTAFDPPIPATLKPLVLLIVCLVALQAVWNLIADWNKEAVVHTPLDDIDEDEIAEIRAHIKED